MTSLDSPSQCRVVALQNVGLATTVVPYTKTLWTDGGLVNPLPVDVGNQLLDTVEGVDCPRSVKTLSDTAHAYRTYRKLRDQVLFYFNLAQISATMSSFTGISVSFLPARR